MRREKGIFICGSHPSAILSARLAGTHENRPMPINYLRNLTGHQRNHRSDRHLGYSLAFIAGAMNAGGFLAIGQYTSHMTGIVSGVADSFAQGQFALAMAGLASLMAFLCGAALTAVLINWARRRQLHSQYALSLLLESILLLVFGLFGAYLENIRDLLAPVTVLLLCFIMGLQNAIITKVSGAVIRTTHVTGLATDIGIELGKLFYVNRAAVLPEVRTNRHKLKLHVTLLCCFLIGGLLGAISFKHVGFSATIPLAIWLSILAIVPVVDDLRGWRRFVPE